MKDLIYLPRASMRFQEAFRVVTKIPFSRIVVSYGGKDCFLKTSEFVETAIRKYEGHSDFQEFTKSHSFEECYSSMFMTPEMQQARIMILNLFYRFCRIASYKQL